MNAFTKKPNVDSWKLFNKSLASSKSGTARSESQEGRITKPANAFTIKPDISKITTALINDQSKKAGGKKVADKKDSSSNTSLNFLFNKK